MRDCFCQIKLIESILQKKAELRESSIVFWGFLFFKLIVCIAIVSATYRVQRRYVWTKLHKE